MKQLVAQTLGILLLHALAHPAFAQEAAPEVCAAPLDGEAEPGLEGELVEVMGEIQLRTGPDIACEGKYLLPAGATIELEECGKEWCLVSYGTERGYLPIFTFFPQPNRAAEDEE